MLSIPVVRPLAILCLAALGACAAPQSGADDDGGSGDEVDPPGEPEPIPLPPPDTVELVPGCTARGIVGGIPAWFFFTRPDRPCSPTQQDGEDYHAMAELVRLIDSVPAGGSIDGHIYDITVDTVGKALLEAQTRGVDVRISVDAKMTASTDAVKGLYLDRLTGIVYCTALSATSSTCISTADNATSHTKLFVFSHATAPDKTESDNVVWFGSPNQSIATGMLAYNNTVTTYGDAMLYTQTRGYLDDLRLQRRFADYYDAASGRGQFFSPAANVFASPEAQTDLVVSRLDDVTPDAMCRVRVMQGTLRDTRSDVMDRLVLMKNGGCQIEVVADVVEPTSLAALKAAKIPVRHMPINDKVFLVYGKFGTAYQYRVYTGSHDIGAASLRRNDDILVRLAPETDASHPVFDEFVTHFNDAYDTGTPL